MPEIENPHDLEAAARLRGEQDDPLVMYLVVRRKFSVSDDELALAAAEAARACAREFAADPLWQERFELWLAASFRKVTLRAEEKEWQALAELAQVRVGDVACLPPRRRSERERLLKRLQVCRGELDLPLFAGAEAGTLELIVNANAPMSAGKTLAQVAHAALMAVELPEAPLRVTEAPRAAWDELIERYSVRIVRDYGLTEVERGTETVLAIVGAAA